MSYASQPLKAGDKVSVRYHSDIKPGTVIRATKSRALVQLHKATLLNGPTSGHPQAMTVSVGGFCAHTEGQQIWDIDPATDDGQVVISFRRGDRINGTTGVWRQMGYQGGLGKLPGVVYEGHSCYYDFNF